MLHCGYSRSALRMREESGLFASGILRVDRSVHIPVDFLKPRQVLDVVARWKETDTKSYVVLLNGHSVACARKEPEVLAAILGAGLVLPDGVSVRLAARLSGYAQVRRVAGPDVMLELCNLGRQLNLRHYLLGGREGVAPRLAERLSQLYAGVHIVGWLAPPFRPLTVEEDREIARRINAADPDVLWVGLGAPKQEKWMAAHRSVLHCTTMIGVGAAFDFHSGQVPRAPQWMRRSGLEWLHRLLQEPRRIAPKALDGARLVCAAVRQVIVFRSLEKAP